QNLYRNVDFVSAGVGGMRGDFLGELNPQPGRGSISVTGIVSNVRRAFLYWHGPIESLDPSVNARVLVNGRLIDGDSLGFSHSDNWGYQYVGTLSGQRFPYAAAYRADVTSLVRAHQNGVYELANFVK